MYWFYRGGGHPFRAGNNELHYFQVVLSPKKRLWLVLKALVRLSIKMVVGVEVDERTSYALLMGASAVFERPHLFFMVCLTYVPNTRLCVPRYCDGGVFFVLIAVGRERGVAVWRLEKVLVLAALIRDRMGLRWHGGSFMRMTCGVGWRMVFGVIVSIFFALQEKRLEDKSVYRARRGFFAWTDWMP